ncbi:Upstream stimulatory factor 1 [Trichinella pseudospiralis]|uniref:Upstream stimulatory factor 1 n=1 Tax=Trichinella pseudospiralis TaxID=6337 RepID=A0A0V1F8Z0_TRIPS|nr:Upstream stimulatory factor 1 [Trichinella pseudospiralis]
MRIRSCLLCVIRHCITKARNFSFNIRNCVMKSSILVYPDLTASVFYPQHASTYSAGIPISFSAQECSFNFHHQTLPRFKIPNVFGEQCKIPVGDTCPVALFQQPGNCITNSDQTMAYIPLGNLSELTRVPLLDECGHIFGHSVEAPLFGFTTNEKHVQLNCSDLAASSDGKPKQNVAGCASSKRQGTVVDFSKKLQKCQQDSEDCQECKITTTTKDNRAEQQHDDKIDHRRMSHNEVEKRRRNKINTAIFELASLLPNDILPSAKEYQSKSCILAKAVEYIQRMKAAKEKSLQQLQSQCSATVYCDEKLVSLLEENRKFKKIFQERKLALPEKLHCDLTENLPN